jgi:hypothetical protein
MAGSVAISRGSAAMLVVPAKVGCHSVLLVSNRKQSFRSPAALESLALRSPRLAPQATESLASLKPHRAPQPIHRLIQVEPQPAHTGGCSP